MASEDVTLHYVTGSAKIYNSGKVSGLVLSTKMFPDEGVRLGIDELNGVITCSNETCSGHVIYTIQVNATGIRGETPNTGNFQVIVIMALIALVVIFVLLVAIL